MKFIFLIIIIIILQNCTLNKVIQHQGIHNLETKQQKLEVNYTNKNDIISLIGPPSIKESFDNELFIYLEKKTSSSKLRKLGKKELITNNVLVLEIDNKGLLVQKKFYNIDEMNNIKFDRNLTEVNYNKEWFINRFLFSVRQKIDDPLGKKRSKVSQQ